MARDESNREDLFAEATAFRRRIELQLAGEPELVVAGLRDDGRSSIYFGFDAAMHFDESGQLRRAYLHGTLFRTQGRTLARLTRHRTPEATVLQRGDLAPDELAHLLQRLRSQLGRLVCRIAAGEFQILRQVPSGDSTLLRELRERAEQWLIRSDPLAPRIAGKP